MHVGKSNIYCKNWFYHTNNSSHLPLHPIQYNYNSFSKHLDTMANMTDFRYCKADFWSIESNQILVWQRDFTANLFRWEILIFVLYIFNSLGSKKGTIFYYNPRKVHSKALILLWNDHQFSIFWFLTKVSSKCQVVWKSKSQVR